MVDQFDQSRTFLLELIILIIELFYLFAETRLARREDDRSPINSSLPKPSNFDSCRLPSRGPNSKSASSIHHFVSAKGPKMRPLQRVASTFPGPLQRNSRNKILVALCFLLSVAPLAHAQELDDYKVRMSGVWWYPQNSGTIYSSGSQGSFNLQKDFGFTYYPTFSYQLDWRFKRKQHLLFGASVLDNSATRAITRTITFEGKTFTVGTQTTASIKTYSFSPGYQYDFIRRDHGYLALGTVFYLLDTKAGLTGVVNVNGQNATQTVSGSTFSPVPVIGPRARWYPLHASNRLSLDGYAQGMYFFGYGDIWSARGAVNFGIVRHLNLTAGYFLGSAVSVHGTNDRIGLELRQKGAIVGLEGSW